jgi:hypothetical protein
MATILDPEEEAKEAQSFFRKLLPFLFKKSKPGAESAAEAELAVVAEGAVPAAAAPPA